MEFLDKVKGITSSKLNTGLDNFFGLYAKNHPYIIPLKSLSIEAILNEEFGIIKYK